MAKKDSIKNDMKAAIKESVDEGVFGELFKNYSKNTAIDVANEVVQKKLALIGLPINNQDNIKRSRNIIGHSEKSMEVCALIKSRGIITGITLFFVAILGTLWIGIKAVLK